MHAKGCIDHLGHVFSSQNEMCSFWGVSAATYTSRMKNGWTQEKALTTNGRSAVKDFNGNLYPSMEAMCKIYKISIDTFQYRIQHGWDLKDALTEPVSDGKCSASTKCKDPKGNIFPSFSAMCRAYGKSRALVRYHLSRGKNLEEALS